MESKQINNFLIISLTAIFIWSFISPKDLFTWFLEVFPVIIGAVVLLLTRHRFKFTTTVYLLLWIHAIILIIGGHYTYAENPLFNWIKEEFNLIRNYYDRLGHFAQGFVPAIVSREILLRTSPLKRGKWLFFIIVCICLAISAFYELIEWWVAIASGDKAVAFLATQGDIWDTQWDMFFALCGSIISLLSLSRLHDKFLRKLEGGEK
jgi:putative membrane protein